MMAPPIGDSAPAIHPQRHAELRDAAKKLEAAFLSQMLKDAGIGAQKGAFGGGIGEDQFASMMRDQQARQMVDSGGIGLAEQLFQSLIKREAQR